MFERMASGESVGGILTISDESISILAWALGVDRLHDLVWHSPEKYLAFTATSGGETYPDVADIEELREALTMLFKPEPELKPEINEDLYYRWKMKTGDSVILSDWTKADLGGGFVGWVRCEPGKTFEEI
jgi:hypothetical protein